MDNKKFLALLSRQKACDEAVAWCKEHGGTSAELWRDCKRGDWMNWFVVNTQKRLGITRPQLVGALADCAALVLKYYEAEYPDDKRVRDCISVCRRYARGKATGEELNAAASAAYAATYAAYAAASAAYAAAYAAYAAAYAARDKTNKKTADIFRKHFPVLDI